MLNIFVQGGRLFEWAINRGAAVIRGNTVSIYDVWSTRLIQRPFLFSSGTVLCKLSKKLHLANRYYHANESLKGN